MTNRNVKITKELGRIAKDICAVFTGITWFYAKDNDVVVSKPKFDRSLDNFMTWYKLFIRYVFYFITNDIDNNN